MFTPKSELPRRTYSYRGREIGEMIHLAQGEDLGGKVKLFTIITMNPGEEVGYHQHLGEKEVFYILSGQGEINDNGNVVQVSEGDVVVTPLDGSHAFRNTGDDEFRFIAMIMTEEKDACPVSP